MKFIQKDYDYSDSPNPLEALGRRIFQLEKYLAENSKDTKAKKLLGEITAAFREIDTNVMPDYEAEKLVHKQVKKSLENPDMTGNNVWDEKILPKAKKLMKSENIEKHQAICKIMEENPELHKAYRLEQDKKDNSIRKRIAR